MKRTGPFLVALSLFGCDLTQDLGGSGGTAGSGGTTANGGSTANGGTTASGGAATGGSTATGGSAGMTTTGGTGGSTGTTTSSGGSIATGGSGGAGTEWAITNVSGFGRYEAVTVDGAGNITTAGWFLSTFDLGSGVVTSKGQEDAFVARYTKDGSLVWAKFFGSTGNDDATEISSDAAGNIYVAGTFEGSVDFGSGPITSQGGRDDYLLKLDPSGNTLWAKGLGGGGVGNTVPYYHYLSLAVDPAGQITIADSYLDPVHIGAVTLNAAGPNPGGQGSDFFVARLDTNGNHVWSHTYGDADSDPALAEVVSDIGLDASGNVFVTGHFGGVQSFGGPNIGVAAHGRTLLFKLDPAGGHLWSKAFGNDSYSSGTQALAVSPDGGVLIAGEYVGLFDINGASFPATQFELLFTAKLDASGANVFTHAVSCPPGTSYVGGAASDASGNIGIAGGTEQSIDFGAGPVTVPWGGDFPFYGRYDPAGAVITGKMYYGPPPINGETAGMGDLAYDPSTGHVVFVGGFNEDLDFGAAEINAASGGRMFVARLLP